MTESDLLAACRRIYSDDDRTISDYTAVLTDKERAGLINLIATIDGDDKATLVDKHSAFLAGVALGAVRRRARLVGVKRDVAMPSPVSGTLYTGAIARTHDASDPLKYEHGNEMRDAAELPRIASQMGGQPVKLGHGGRVIGKVIAAHVDGQHVVAQLMIHDRAGLAAISSGTSELSLGYDTRSDNGYQRDIKPFELAVVPRGRCGPSCRLQTDSRADHCGCPTILVEDQRSARDRVDDAERAAKQKMRDDAWHDEDRRAHLQRMRDEDDT